MREIKPDEINHCAECGSEAVMYYNGAEFMIWCTKCKNASYALTQEKVLLEWNALNPKTEIPSKQPPEIPVEKSEELPELKPCPFCGSMPVEYNGCIRCEAPDCYVQPGVKSEMPEFLPKLWNQMVMIESEDEKQESDKFHQPYLNPCVRCGGLGLIEGDSTERRAWCYSCDNEIIIKGKSTEKQIIDAWNEENPILNPCAKCGFPAKRRNYPDIAIVYCPECMDSSIGKTMAEAVRKWNEKNPEEAELEESDPWKHDCKVLLNPCAQCGTDPESEIEGDLSLGWVECPNCGKRVQTKENVTPEKLVYMWNEENPLKEERQSVMESSKQQSETLGPFKPCAKCGSAVELRISLTDHLGYIKCPRCGFRLDIDTGNFKNVEEIVEKWDEVNTKPERRTELPVGPNELNPCARCGVVPDSPAMSFTCDDEVCISCGNCGRAVCEVKRADAITDWNKLNPGRIVDIEPRDTKPKTESPEMPSVNWLFNIPDRTAQMLLFKLDVLNSVLGLQRDSEGPVYVVNTIQNDLIEIANHIRDGETWYGLDKVKELEFEIDKMKKDHVLQFPKEESIDVHGSFYVTALHIARAICREAELYAWDYEQKKGIEKMSQIPEYLNRLGDWLFIKAEYLRETEECC